MSNEVTTVSWADFSLIIGRLSASVRTTPAPDMIVAVQRGGLIPATMLSHQLGVREFGVLDICRTETDHVESAKKPARYRSLSRDRSDFERKSVLLVDDVSGTGQTLDLAAECLRLMSVERIQTLACYVNRAEWDISNDVEPSQRIDFIGKELSGWIIFPWEVGGNGPRI